MWSSGSKWGWEIHHYENSFGLERADSGEVIFNGKHKDIVEENRFDIGALIESPAIYLNLSAFDNLKTRALLHDIPDERIYEVLPVGWFI